MDSLSYILYEERTTVKDKKKCGTYVEKEALLRLESVRPNVRPLWITVTVNLGIAKMPYWVLGMMTPLTIS